MWCHLYGHTHTHKHTSCTLLRGFKVNEGYANQYVCAVCVCECKRIAPPMMAKTIV